MGTIEPSQPPSDVSAAALHHLGRTRPWVKFLAMLGFVLCALMLLGSVGVMLAAAFVPNFGAGQGLAFALVYLLVALIYAIPCWYLNRYAKAIAELQRAPTTRALEQALSGQATFWRIVGIVTLVVIILEVVVIALVAVVAILAAVSS